jgi:hypothetical protein
VKTEEVGEVLLKKAALVVGPDVVNSRAFVFPSAAVYTIQWLADDLFFIIIISGATVRL